MTKTKITKKTPPKRPRGPRHQLRTEIIGWCGAIAVLAAYGLANFNAISVHSLAYQLLNLAGALGILTIATAKHVRQSMVVNAFWAVMALIALIKIVFQV